MKNKLLLFAICIALFSCEKDKTDRYGTITYNFDGSTAIMEEIDGGSSAKCEVSYDANGHEIEYEGLIIKGHLNNDEQQIQILLSDTIVGDYVSAGLLNEVDNASGTINHFYVGKDGNDYICTPPNDAGLWVKVTLDEFDKVGGIVKGSFSAVVNNLTSYNETNEILYFEVTNGVFDVLREEDFYFEYY